VGGPDCSVGSVVIVFVKPGRECVPACWLGRVEPFERRSFTHGAVEAFDLPVGLRPVGVGLLRFDAQIVARVAPGVGFVGGTVIGEDTFDGDAAGSEPRRGSTQHADRGDRCFGVVNRGVGDAGVVVDAERRDWDSEATRHTTTVAALTAHPHQFRR